MNKPENNLRNRSSKIYQPPDNKNIALPEKKQITAHWVHLLLWTLLGFILFFSVSNAIYPHLFWHHFTFEDRQLHSTVESLGAIAAILIAFMPLQVLFGKYRPSYLGSL